MAYFHCNTIDYFYYILKLYSHSRNGNFFIQTRSKYAIVYFKTVEAKSISGEASRMFIERKKKEIKKRQEKRSALHNMQTDWRPIG